MFFRVILFTLFLGSMVVLHFIWGRPEALGRPYIRTLFVFITIIFLLNISYVFLLRLRKHLQYVAFAQVVLDLLTSALLVHFTGSAESGFLFFFLLIPISAAIVFDRRTTLITTAIGIFVLFATILLGYYQILPLLPGQDRLPWTVHVADLVRSLLMTSGAMIAVGALSGYLSELLRRVATTAQEQQAHIADLTVLHEDVIRCLTSGLLTIDSVGQVLTINSAACELLNVKEEDAINRPLISISPELGFIALGSHKSTRKEIQLEVNEGKVFYGVSISPLEDRDGNKIGRIINFQDLTTLRQMEEMMKRSEHLAALGRVAAGVAHELRNPLASISGSLELLQIDVNDDSKRLMKIALREIERLDGLVNDLLDHAKPRDKQELTRVDLNAEIGRLVDKICHLSREHNAIDIKITETEPNSWVMADLDAVQGVLWNLIRNASDAKSTVIDLSVVKQNEYIDLVIKDNGLGIEKEKLNHIFEPFFTTKSKGSGLGLATVHRTISEHNGTIKAESQKGEGTKFTISLPYAEEN